ncbi:alpha/beta hydrolase-fold protein [Imperialibacter roseus]|uniref:Alpha/beta hydrolase-fold protein n=1 Tax=Imperialibacter roseus TaxID=1324217 RepID=A0ABZ0IXB9_9BACT|nr:alpha/beta hydrolase-fold protein [Imperialibacter roseus]WOK09281.1 alpha/beta hydrolase-fold protein [Imperialibacter roseus]
MKRHKASMLYPGVIIGAYLLMTLLGSCQDEDFNPSLTQAFDVQSAANGATYPIRVALPTAYYTSAERYPAIYVLDGEENFGFVANHCREISERLATQNVVVVSIGYGQDRSIDYTPTKTSEMTGGGTQFLDFIETQLIPQMEERFRVDTTRNGRVLLGHSYGGLFGACVLAVNNQLFGNYLLLSPSIWFDNEVSLQLEKAYRAANKDQHHLVFLGIGELENAGRMQAPFEAFYEALRDNYADISLAKNREKHLDHVGSRQPNIVKGLNYYFQNRQL